MSKTSYSTLDDFSLVQKTRDGDSQALLELSARHSGIYYDRVRKVGWSLTDCEREDLREEKESFIYEAAGKFDENRGMKFPSFLGQMTTWKIQSLRTQASKAPVFVSESILEKRSGAQSCEEDYSRLMDAAFVCSDKRTNDILRMKADGKSFEEIAGILGLSKYWTRTLYNEGIKRIKEKYLND